MLERMPRSTSADGAELPESSVVMQAFGHRIGFPGSASGMNIWLETEINTLGLRGCNPTMAGDGLLIVGLRLLQLAAPLCQSSQAKQAPDLHPVTFSLGGMTVLIWHGRNVCPSIFEWLEMSLM